MVADLVSRQDAVRAYMTDQVRVGLDGFDRAAIIREVKNVINAPPPGLIQRVFG
jgi:hypothetical protein